MLRLVVVSVAETTLPVESREGFGTERVGDGDEVGDGDGMVRLHAMGAVGAAAGGLALTLGGLRGAAAAAGGGGGGGEGGGWLSRL